MSRYEFNIQLTYIENNSKNIVIPELNVQKLVKLCDYTESNMPTMFCVLNIDKSLHDRILLNAKNSTMALSIFMHECDSDPMMNQLIYSGECEYFVSDDINYNKEIDYAGQNKDRQDIYIETYIGLMWKNNIEWNKKTTNTTIKETGMQEIVLSLLQNIPLLIEPFTYSDKFDQLIIPPQDSLVKAIKFLNDIKVFYDTQYRLFFDSDCMYLVSSKGNGIAKNTDKYDTVKITVHKLDDAKANILGMTENDKSKCYEIEVNAVDTVYNINHPEKEINNVVAITNPAKNNTVLNLDSIQNVVGSINNITSGISNAVNNVINNIEFIPATMNNIKDNFWQNVKNSNNTTSITVSAIDQSISLIEAMPEPPEDGEDSGSTDGGEGSEQKTMTREEKDYNINKLRNYRNILVNNSSSYGTVYNNYNSGIGRVIETISTASNMGSVLGCVTSINAKDNQDLLNQSIISIRTGTADISNYCNTVLQPAVDQANAMLSATQASYNLVSTVLDPLDLPTVDSPFNDAISSYRSIVSDTTNNIFKHSQIPIITGDLGKQFDPLNSSLRSIQTNIKNQITSVANSISSIGNLVNNIGQHAKSMMDNINANDKKIASNLSSKNISMTTVSQLVDNPNAIQDISGIAQLGLSKFNMNLNFGKNNGTGTEIVRVNNDNANMVKNLVSELSNKQSIFEFHKMDLNPSILNINQKYIISNYNAHSGKDGVFLLDKKIEIYIRQDTNYKLDTVLQFRKIGEIENVDSTGNKSSGGIVTNSEASRINEITHIEL